MTATENNGLPTIGRIVEPLDDEPEQRGEDQRHDDAQHPGEPVRPSMLAIGFLTVVNGMCSSTIEERQEQRAGTSPSAPWEKLTSASP